MQSSVNTYNRVARVLHALTGLALIVQLGFGVLLDDLAPRGTPGRAGWINLHKSVGLLLLLLVLLRLLWRLRHRPPAWPPNMSAVQQRAAGWGHAALYAAMLVLPASGYVASNFSKHGLKFFGLPLPPWGTNLPLLYGALSTLHKMSALALTVLILGHVAMALKHQFMDCDDLMRRIKF
ncbi:cytochrome b [Roseateles koreensis]|uniref:Cytochrome b/b6 domain-containing protein n=1 Tax=Roseateles koreensis TaxID=2987526 RepID=A0ABT5KW50_9BURK|nr:cytochrome b/b6 domain-containing protein [Roseateles koreensis]MDC8787166.1 cytochrome b/b6 domain-containing protein [Roseateles koreensis]